MTFNKIYHFLIGPSIYGSVQLDVILLCKIFDQLICTETLMTFFTIHQRIRKTSQMSGSNPGLWVHQDGAVHTDIVWVFLYELLPPCTLHIVFQFYTKISVIPCICKTSVDFRSRIYKTSCFCYLHNFVHRLFHYVILTFYYVFSDPPKGWI